MTKRNAQTIEEALAEAKLGAQEMKHKHGGALWTNIDRLIAVAMSLVEAPSEAEQDQL